MNDTIFEVLLSKRDTDAGLALHIDYDNEKNRYAIAEEEDSTEGEKEGLPKQHEYGTLSEALGGDRYAITTARESWVASRWQRMVRGTG